MASNKKKIFITESFSQAGRSLLGERDDIEMVEFSNMISAGDFQAKLREHAPVHGVALGGTRFGEPELEASQDMMVVTRIGVGFDAVDVLALSRRKVPLMVAGGTGRRQRESDAVGPADMHLAADILEPAGNEIHRR